MLSTILEGRGEGLGQSVMGLTEALLLLVEYVDTDTRQLDALSKQIGLLCKKGSELMKDHSVGVVFVRNQDIMPVDVLLSEMR